MLNDKYIYNYCFAIVKKNTIFGLLSNKQLKRIKYFILFFIFLSIFFVNNTIAQDIHFSQYYASPMSLSPSETGYTNYNWRFSNNYRTQWNAIGIPYRTISVGIDMPVKLKPKSCLGIGAFVVNDNSGISKLTVNKVYLSTAYIRTINKKNHLSIGLQLGYVFKNFSMKGLTLPDQFNRSTGEFDPDYPTSHRDYYEDLNYIDINTGISYFHNDGKLNPYGGISLFHINTPKETFLNSANTKLPIRMAMYGGVKINLPYNLMFNPQIFTMHNKKAGDWILGALMYYYISDKFLLRNIFGGMHTRTTFNNLDAIIVTGGVNVYGFDIGISYDLNISKLRFATKFKGAFEISLIYKDISKKTAKITLPCDRY